MKKEKGSLKQVMEGFFSEGSSKWITLESGGKSYKKNFIRLLGKPVQIVEHTIPRKDGSFVHAGCLGVDCPACDYVKKLYDKGLDTKAKKFRAQKRVLWNAICRGEGGESAVKIFAYGKTIHEGIVDLVSKYGNIAHPRKGREVVVRRKGEGIGTKYDVKDTAKKSPLTDEEKELELIDLNEILHTPTKKQMLKMLGLKKSDEDEEEENEDELEDDEDDEDEEDEEDEDDEDQDEDNDNEDEEDGEEEDDDEGDDEEDDEDDEPKVKKSKAKKKVRK